MLKQSCQLQTSMHNKILHLIVASLCLLLPVSVAQNVAGTVNVKLDFYRQRNRNTCDASILYSDFCDPYFVVSVSSSAVLLSSLTSTEFDDATNVIQFGNSVGQLPNPLQFRFAESFFRPKDQVVVFISVKDRDPHDNDDLMTSFRLESSISNVTTFANDSFDGGSIRPVRLYGTSSGHTLKLAVWIRCARDYYQTGCSVHCDPRKFNCSATGAPICPSGHMVLSGSCQPADKCTLNGPNYCHNGGTCVDATLAAEPSCRCSEDFTGPRCQVAIHPCQRNATWCRQGVCRGGFNSSEAAGCVCDVGYAGNRCDEDVNECSQLEGPCGVGGDCVNTVGSFRCACKPGFSSDLCQTKQTFTAEFLATTTELGRLGRASDSQVFLAQATATSTLLLTLLLILISAFAALTIGYLIYRNGQASNYDGAANVAFRANEPQSVSIEQPHTVESAYYEEAEEAAAAGNSAKVTEPESTENVSNPGYSNHAGQSATLTGQSRTFSKKAQPSEPQLPPRVMMSTSGLEPYLVPDCEAQS